MPKTYISSTIDSARQLLSSLNYPIIMKFPQGTQGKGVMFADSFSSASSILDALSALKQSFIIQEYVDTGATDLRAFVVGDRVVASMIRRGAKDEVRSNIHTGGSGESFEIDEHTKQIAIKAAKAIGAEICGVDILQSFKGPLVIEANISPGLQGITKATKVDVANLIAKYLFEQTKLRKNVKDSKDKKEVMADINNENVVITNLDFRGARILLPEMVSMISKIKSEDQIEICVKKDEVNLKKII
jgi:ribosomal protein S6--L-glutamate ligase